MNHLDPTVLVDLADALDGAGLDAVRHLDTCETCRATYDHVAAVRAALGSAVEPDAGFTDRVVASLEADRRGERRAAGVVAAVNGMLGAAAATFGVALGAGPGGPEFSGTVALVAIVGTGLGLAWVTRAASDHDRPRRPVSG